MSSSASLSITVRLYSILRNRDGRIVNQLELEVPQGSQVADILRLLEVPSNLEVILAINDQVTTEAAVLQDSDRLAIIPAVAGGAVSRFTKMSPLLLKA
jgi:sulfur carrier protein ThiS